MRQVLPELSAIFPSDALYDTSTLYFFKKTFVEWKNVVLLLAFSYSFKKKEQSSGRTQ